MTTDGVSLKNVEQLARTRPDKFDVRTGRGELNGCGHQGNRILPCVGDAARKNRKISGRSTFSASAIYLLNLGERQQRRYVNLNSGVTEQAD